MQGTTGGEDGAASGGGAGALKYVVPGCVGALSLVLARRWGAGGAAHAAATGVSRRRRLAACRDPPVKRPPPTRPPLKVGVEEERRMASSGARPSGGHEVPRVPRHIPFPDIPRDDELLFEATTFLFTALSAAAQFLNLYRTVWWLPHSYNNQTMNFYLIDKHLVLFIMFVLGRRLFMSLLTASTRIVCPDKFSYAVLKILNFLTLGVFTSACSWSLYNIFLIHPAIGLFFLCYPVSIYFLLFGVRIDPLFRLDIPSLRVPHCCANGAPAIRNEVELLKADFNYKLKQIIFSSLIGAYYASFVPWCFAQHFLHYDVYRIIRHLALVWIGLFTQHATHCLSARYCDQLHRAALHLGRWVRKNSSMNLTQTNALLSSSGGFSIGASPIGSWCHKTVWAAGSSVKHGKWTYLSVGTMTAAEPGNLMHLRFYTLFYNPSNMLCALLCMQISLVVFLIVFLLYTTEWHFIVSLSLLLFSNYYTLFKLVRDYFVTWKVYQTESRIQEKINTSNS